MKRKITFSLTLTLSVLLSLVSPPATAQGQQRQRFAARSGVVTLPMSQILRVTVVPTGNDPIRVRFVWRKYMAAGCSGMPPVCRHTVESQGVTDDSDSATSEFLSFDVVGTGGGVEVTVFSASRDVQVNAIILDMTTGQVLTVWDIDNDGGQ